MAIRNLTVKEVNSELKKVQNQIGYIIANPGGGGSAAWGSLTGTLSAQTDLNTQLGLKAPLASPTFTGTVVLPSTTSIGSVTNTEISYLSGVTSAIQTQLNSKIGTLNTLTDAVQTFAFGSTGDASGLPQIISASGVHTFHIPDASSTSTARGLVNGVAQSFVGIKTFTSGLTATNSNTNLYIASTTASGNINTAGYLTTTGTTINTRVAMGAGSSSTAVTASANYAGIILAGGAATEASSGTHDLLAGVAIIAPAFTNGTATTTNAATLYISGPATGTATYTNTYALWVDSGNAQFDGTVTSVGALTTAGGFAATNSSYNLYVPTTNGITNSSGSTLLFGGLTGVGVRTVIGNGTGSAITGGSGYANLIITGAATEAATGAHPIVASLAVKGVVLTDAAGTTTAGATVYIEGPATGTATITSTYALWVDSGNSRFDGNVTADQLNVTAMNTAPASATATGTTGEIRVTAGFIYVCTATNTWVRAALSTW